MTTINESYINALLADATYALDSNELNNLTGDDLKRILQDRMTPTLAKYISDNFTVVTHKETDDILGSGFDATVWKDKAGKVYVSMQGSTGISDFIDADVDLTVSGVAKSQIEEMVNWWLQNTTPAGEEARQIILTFDGNFELKQPIFGPVIGTGILSDISNISLNGHSLGGHLATAFTRLFGKKWPVDQTYTYNSAGFNGGSDTLFDQIAAILGESVGLDRFPTEDEQSNFFAEHGINVTTQNLFNGQQGLRIALFNEEQTLIPNHLMYKLTDALALGTVLEAIDGSVGIDVMNALFDAASNQAEASLESMLDSLRKLVFGEGITATPIGDDDESALTRTAFHENLAELKGVLFANSDNLVLVPNPQYQNLHLVDTNTLADSAQLDTVDGFSYRYALEHLNPFAVTGNANFYAQHNQNGELNSEHFSDQYLQDRAHMLAVKNQFFAEDKLSEFNSPAGDTLYSDLATGLDLRQTSGLSTLDIDRTQTLFGSDKDETGPELNGGRKNDHIYGGQGNDTLRGMAGDDYLEGNQGIDTLYGGEGDDNLLGGKGSDIYVYTVGHDNDTIIDSDGLGSIKWNNQILTTVSLNESNSHVDDTKGIIYVFEPDSEGGTVGTLKILDIANPTKSSITIKKYTLGQLGLTNIETASEDSDTNLDISQQADDSSNFIHNPAFYDGKNAELFGLGGDDYLRGFTGDDVLHGGMGNDWLTADTGDDWLDGGDGNDTLISGSGTDFALGGAGNDFISANSFLYPTLILDSSDNDISISQQKQWEIIQSKYSVYQQGTGLAASYPSLSFSGFIEDNPDISYIYTPNAGLYGQGTLSLHSVSTGDTGLYHLATESSPFSDYSLNVFYGESGDDILIGNDGTDFLSGGTGNDALYGNAGNDSIDGGEGNDYLVGADGNDRLDGAGGNDILTGNDGDDRLYGGAGDDYLWGASSSLAKELQGNDFLDGGDGNDQLVGGDGFDTLIGGQGEDTLFGQQGDDMLDGGSEHDELQGGDGNDTLRGGSENDDLFGEVGDDKLYGDAGSDYLSGGSGEDVLEGGTGDDELYGEGGKDTFVLGAGDGVDIIRDADGSDIVRFKADVSLSSITSTLSNGADGQYLSIQYGQGDVLHIKGGFEDLISSYQFSDGSSYSTSEFIEKTLTESLDYILFLDATGVEVIGGRFGDTLIGNELANTLIGNSGNDSLDGQAGDDELYGGSGQDILIGGTGNDTLRGGTGNNDHLMGGSGDDTYLFYLGDGNTTISEFEGGIDTLRFVDISSSDVAVSRSIHDLRITVIATSVVIKVANYFNGSSSVIESVEFSDNESWDMGVFSNLPIDVYGSNDNDTLNGDDAQDVIYALGGDDSVHGNGGNDTIYGGEGKDSLFGDDGDDILSGGTGNGDILSGGAGNDTYLFALGDGNTNIDNYDTDTGSRDVLKFSAGISPSEVSVTRVGLSLEILVQSTSELITLDHFYPNSNGKYPIDTVEFDDGTVWDMRQFEGLLEPTFDSFNDYVGGSDLGDVINGLGGSDIIYGYGGNDTLYAGRGEDALFGGDGNDNLYGALDRDYLEGNSDDDNLEGGGGEDKLFGGEGNDTLNGGGHSHDSVDMGTAGYFGGSGGYFHFLDLGDYLEGGEGNDTYIYSFEDDSFKLNRLTTINNYDEGGLSSDDVLRFAEDVSVSMVSVHRGRAYVGPRETDDQLSITITEQSKTSTILIQDYFLSSDYELNSIEFFDGTIWTPEDIRLLITNHAPIVNRIISNQVTDENALYNYQLPTDTFIDSDGDSLTYAANLVGGGVLPTWLTFDAATLTFSAIPENDDVGNIAIEVTATDLGGESVSDSFELTVNNINDAPTLESEIINQIQAESTVFNFAFPTGTFADIDAGDSLTYSASLYGGDSLPSWLSFDAMTQTFSGVANSSDIGSLSIVVTATDTSDLSVSDRFSVVVAELNDRGGIEVYGSNYADDITGTDHDDFIDGYAGDDRLEGRFGNDSLSGGQGNDVLVGGPGNDYLSGRSGNDIYLFNLGDGQDIVRADTSDKIIFGAGITPELLQISQSGNMDTLITIFDAQGNETGDSITIPFSFANSIYQVGSIEFADGSSLTGAELYLAARTFEGTNDSDIITGTNRNDTISSDSGNDVIDADRGDDVVYAGDGDDIVDGGRDNDIIYGGAGNDTIKGGEVGGHDLIVGGLGNDTLEGGAGDDTYIFNLGDGQDTIRDYSGIDNIVLGPGISKDFLHITQSGSTDIVISFTDSLGNATGDQLTLIYAFSIPTYGIEQLSFADGGVLTHEELMVAALTVDGSASDDVLDGSRGNDVISGYAGNDTLWGGKGADILMGGDGDDLLKDYEGDDILEGGKGNDRLQGGIGNNAYIFNIGDGQDYIQGGGEDKIIFGAGISRDTIKISAVDPHIVISLLDSNGDVTGDSITLHYAMYRYDDPARVESIEFADGFVMTGTEIFAQAHILNGSEGDNVLNATKFGITLNGYAGNDILNGERGNDILYGGAGDDVLNGGGNEGKDTLIGGQGNDSLNGAKGDDTYVFNVGDGQDIITDYAGDDNLEIHVDSYESLWFSQQGNNLAITLAGSDNSVMLANWYSNTVNQIEEIVVGDSVLLNAQVDQLVSAMASFDVPSGVGNVIPQDTKDALQSILVSSWG